MLTLPHLKNNPRLKTYNNNVLFSLFLVRLISSSLADSDWKQKAVTGEVNTFFYLNTTDFFKWCSCKWSVRSWMWAAGSRGKNGGPKKDNQWTAESVCPCWILSITEINYNRLASIRARRWINGRKLPGLFFTSKIWVRGRTLGRQWVQTVESVVFPV